MNPASTSAGDAYAADSHPGARPLDVDGYPLAPPELELEQVHVYVRHGALFLPGLRTKTASAPPCGYACPTHPRPSPPAGLSATPRAGSPPPSRVTRPPGATRRCPYNGSSSAKTGPRRRASGECSVSARLWVVTGEGRTSVDVFFLGWAGDGSLLGELTDVGRQTTYDFGLALRRLYIDRLGFLSDTVQSDRDVYFRSTNVPRTVESLHQVIHGLYPAGKCGHDYAPQIRIRNAIHENLFGNTGACKRLEVLAIGFARAAHESWNPVLERLDPKVSKYIGGRPIRLDGQPRASGILDTIRAAVANNISVPHEMTEKGVIDVIEKAVVHEWYGGCGTTLADSTEEVRRLGMGRLLADVSLKMQQQAARDETPRILVHSTHDTTLAAICATFDVFDERWPAFTSYISFELFRKHDNQSAPPSLWQTVLSPFRQPDLSNHYVRMRYQNKNMVLPVCQAEGKHLPGHPEFCTLAAFRDRVRELTPVDWAAECAPAVNASRA
ncbi:hypothetical protein EIP86_003110 [Pleurotus ostreatoroseus]|nr:hypothetical protein EIP86_003110 [Pleurotus ostreatoroseus]